MRLSLFWDVTQRRFVVIYRRFVATYRSHLNYKKTSRTVWPLKMEQIGCPETWVTNYKSTMGNTPEERRSHLHGGGSQISRKTQDIIRKRRFKLTCIINLEGIFRNLFTKYLIIFYSYIIYFYEFSSIAIPHSPKHKYMLAENWTTIL
jgi:hypothetical protein